MKEISLSLKFLGLS